MSTFSKITKNFLLFRGPTAMVQQNIFSLPFGLSSAPYIFTKLLKPIVKKWRSQGNSIVIFLDDGLGAGRTYTLAKIFSLQAHADLLKFGFLPNESKCEWDPIQEITWLGVVINTLNCTLHLTAKRVNSILTDIDNIIAQKNKKLHVKRFASICGKIISCGSCVGNISKLVSRHLYALINSAPNWNWNLNITEAAIAELRFWKDNLGKINGIPIWPNKTVPTKIVYSDASDTGCRSVIEMEGRTFHQNWSELESHKSSTYRELRTVELALKSFLQELKSQFAVWFTDNQNVTKIISSRSRIIELQNIALEIFSICVKYGVTLDVQWIPRDRNYITDEISKIIDFDDYTLHDDVFDYIDAIWGPHSCDRFACYYNTKLKNFNTRCSSNLEQNWGNDNNWLCPPPYLIIKAISHASTCKAQGTIIIPV